MATKTKTAWEQLRELDSQLVEARRNVERYEAEQRQTARRLDAATAPLQSYFEEVGAGEREPDVALERQLEEALREVKETVTLRPKFSRASGSVDAPDAPGGATGGLATIEAVDIRAEALLAGAIRAVDEAEERIVSFLRTHRDQLAQELMPETVAARDGFTEAWEPIRAANREWLRVRALWDRLSQAGGIDPAELPAQPLQGLDPAIDVGGVPLPMPASLVPSEEEAA